MQRFNKDMVAAFTRLTSKKRIPPKPAKPIVKKIISPVVEKGSNENLYMIGASMFYFVGTLVQIELQNKKHVFDGQQAKELRDHQIAMQLSAQEHEKQLKADQVKSSWTQLYEGIITTFNTAFKSEAVINKTIESLTKPTAQSNFPSFEERIFFLLFISICCYSTYYKAYFILLRDKLYLIFFPKKK